jgi:hypothetical protein
MRTPTGASRDGTSDQVLPLPHGAMRRGLRAASPGNRMLIRVFFVSVIADSVSDIDVRVILGASQVNNRRLDVTGMLAQSDGHFAQVLEGRTDVMGELMAKIAADTRHRALRMLLQETIVTRQFSRWSMGLIRRDDMSEQMRVLHRDGCENKAQARRTIQMLMSRDG